MVEIKQAQHTHTLFDGRETGLDIKNLRNPNSHWHEVAGDKTSTDSYGEGHMHDVQGDKTSGPIAKDNDEDSEMSSLHDDDDDKSIGVLELKYFGGKTTEVKEEEVNGVPVGVISGYIATWGLDRGNDRFIRGAFKDSLIELRAKNRPIRLKDHHMRTIGGFPIDHVYENERGLFGMGHINLEVQQGREAFSLAKQGILSDFSIGFSVIEFEIDGYIRSIHKATVWEGSLVDEPMNVNANVTEIKDVVPFQDLKVSERNHKWDPTAALSRIREFTSSNENPNVEYKKAFVWFDSKESHLFGAYKLPIADIIDDHMTVVPNAIFSAAASLKDARSGIDFTEIDLKKSILHIERYYAKMNIDSPFTDKQYYVSGDVKEWKAHDLEKFLKKSGLMSQSASRILASRIGKKEKDKSPAIPSALSLNWDQVLKELKSIDIHE